MKTILVLELFEDSYQELGNLKDDNLVQSPNFPELHLTVSEVFKNV